MRPASLFLSALMLAPACASESDELLPVSTTADGKVSTAPSSREAARRSNGFVRFVHAVPEVASVDVYANDMRIFTGAAFGSVTSFRELGDADYSFRIRNAGEEMATPLAIDDDEVDAGRHYTLVAFRKEGAAEAKLQAFDDDLLPPKAGSAKLRLINASPDAGEVDLFTPGAEKPILSGVDYRHASDYVEIQPMVGRLAIRREGEKSPLVELPITTFDAGKVYTVIMVGYTRTAPSVTRVVFVEDRFGAP